MESLTKKHYIKSLIKVSLTFLALYIVFRRIDIKQVIQTLKTVNLGWLALAALFFNISKIMSSLRIEHLLKVIKVSIERIENIKLCYVGMFYNLFLPGGIGGDGYKVYYLKKASSLVLLMMAQNLC